MDPFLLKDLFGGTTPMLSATATQVPVRREVRDRLFAEHADMARRIALKLARRVPGLVSADDLVGAALLGLAEAVNRYSAERGEAFCAYAVARIRGAIMDELRRGDIMPRRVRRTARQLSRTVRELEHSLGRRPEEEEIARALDVSVEEYRERIEVLAQVAIVALDPMTDAASTPANAEHEVERAQLVSRVRAALGRLPERDALVLSLYYDDELSYAEIGEVIGVSESRVCQLHKRAIAALRRDLA
jgi:RNA polymerase sigma factor for flagellar operon FliA